VRPIDFSMENLFSSTAALLNRLVRYTIREHSLIRRHLVLTVVVETGLATRYGRRLHDCFLD
jgi:hypothetical protein